MTVAAVVLAARPESALADADGVPRVRRIVDAAWAGGATPVVVVSFDPEGAIAASLAGAPVTLAEPAPIERGPAGQMVRGVDVALGLVPETDAALIWPARLCWVGPETVTSLIEASGAGSGGILRPTYHGEPGWPLLVPVALLERLRGQPVDRMPDDVAADMAAAPGAALVELGDPGTVIDGDTPRIELPPYEGPPEPVAGHVHEWGDDVEAADEAPPAPETIAFEDVR
jgi:CTP:molybdopterin cytidylyltransferase MocA